LQAIDEPPALSDTGAAPVVQPVHPFAADTSRGTRPGFLAARPKPDQAKDACTKIFIAGAFEALGRFPFQDSALRGRDMSVA